jgi:hypothetical protein
MWSCGLDSHGTGQGLVADYYEHGNEHSGFKKQDNFSTWLLSLEFPDFTLIYIHLLKQTLHNQ